MKLYLRMGIFFLVGLVITGTLFFKIQPQYILLYFAITVAIVGVVSIIMSVVARIMPKAFFQTENIFFQVRPIEKRIYEKLGIKKWKTKIPDAGKVLNIKKSSLDSIMNKNYLRKFIEETRYSEFVHVTSATFSVISLFIVSKFILTVVLPTYLLSVVMHLMPAMVQRYNRPRLLKTYERAQNICFTDDKAMN